MSLDKILEYQKIDHEIYREELNLVRGEENQKIGALTKEILAAQQNLINLDSETGEIYQEISALEKQVSSLNSQDKSLPSLSSINTLEQLESMEKTLSALSEQIVSLERDIKRAFKKLSNINSDAYKSYEAGMNLKKELAKQKEKYAKKIKEMRVKFQSQAEALNELRKDIDPALFKAYKNLRDNKKMPAFAPYYNGNCSACGIDIHVEVESKLINAGDSAECPNCRRIVYIK